MAADAHVRAQLDEACEIVGDELPRGTVLLRGQYTIASFLNAGGFGITYLARDSLDRTVVIKECFPSSMCCRRGGTVRVRSRSSEEDFSSIVRFFGQEARALAKLKHPNIVGVHQVFEDNNTAYMALDLIEGRDLLDVIEGEPSRLGPDQIRAILLKLLDAVAYIHDRGVLHRDISPDNILLDTSDNPVLIDFGAAREQATRVSRLVTQNNTVKDGYSPQEFYVSGAKQMPASDLYALAATFYHMIAGCPPPISQLRLAAVAEGGRDPYEPLSGRVEGYDRFFLDAIDRCLSIFPKDRLESAQAWLVLIDAERRRQAQREDFARDDRMQRRIRRLVTETNRTVTPGPVRIAPEPSHEDPREAIRRTMFADLGEPPPDPDESLSGEIAEPERGAGRDGGAAVADADRSGPVAAPGPSCSAELPAPGKPPCGTGQRARRAIRRPRAAPVAAQAGRPRGRTRTRKRMKRIDR